MFEFLVFPTHSVTDMQRKVARFRAAHPYHPIETIDLHILYGGAGCTAPGTTVKKSRLAAFGRFIAKHAIPIELEKGDNQ